MNNKKLVIAAAITGMIAAGSLSLAPTAQAAEKGECHGVNACKGKGECGGKGHACAGKNECAGKGWKQLSKQECEAAILKAAKEKGMFFKKG